MCGWVGCVRHARSESTRGQSGRRSRSGQPLLYPKEIWFGSKQSCENDGASSRSGRLCTQCNRASEAKRTDQQEGNAAYNMSTHSSGSWSSKKKRRYTGLAHCRLGGLGG